MGQGRRVSPFQLLAVVLVLLSARAHAGPAEDAEALNEQGKALYQKRDYPAAAEKLRAAIALSPRAKYWFNLGRVLDDMGRRAEAADAYERYLGLPDQDARTAAWVSRRLGELEPQVARLEVRTGAERASVRINGAPLPAGGAEVRIRLDPGTYVVSAEVDGRQASETVALTAGQRATVDLTAPLAPPPVAPAPPKMAPVAPSPAPTPAPRPVASEDVTPWWHDRIGGALAGGAVVALGLGTTFYLMSNGDLDDAEAAPTLAAHDAAVDDARSRRTVARWAGVAGVALAAGAALRYWLHDAPRAGSVDVAIEPSGAGFGVAIGGRF